MVAKGLLLFICASLPRYVGLIGSYLALPTFRTVQWVSMKLTMRMSRRLAPLVEGVPVRVMGRIAVALFLALLLAPPAASAHVRSTTGFSEITQQGKGIRYELSLEYELLAATVGLGEKALAAATDAERERALEKSEQRIASYLEPNLTLSLDGVECPGAVEGTGAQRRQDVPYAVVVLSYQCPGSPAGAYAVTYGVFSDSESVVDEHTNVVDYLLDEQRGRFVFDNGHRELLVGAVGLLSSSARFVTMGVEHILAGADHVVFVVALLLGAGSFKSVMRLALAFTAAHSVTLALAALGWVDVPPEIVEPLIALSIAYVAAELVLGSGTRHRTLITFGFGLLHGLGFASALTFSSDISWQLLSSLLTFNIGIEMGQALIILFLFPLLSLVRRRYAWSRLAHSGAAAVIAVLGTFWFFERLLA